MNAYYGKKKIVVVSVGDNALAKEIVAEMKTQGMQNATILPVPDSYAAYYKLAQMKPDYVMFVNESNHCQLKVTKVNGIVGDKLGHVANRKTDTSREAMNYYKHELRMIGLEPVMLGAEIIGFRDVKDIPWFYTNSAPMLHLHLPDVPGADKAVTEAVKDYFKAVGKRQSEAEKKAEKESKNCCGLKGAVDRG